MKKICYLLAILALSTAFCGCGSQSPSPTAMEEAGIKAEKKAKNLTEELSIDNKNTDAQMDEISK